MARRQIDVCAACLVMLATGCLPARALAQGGPPLLTDDPGTAEYKHWEINLAVLPEIRSDSEQFELPLADFNYGATDHTQLKFEIPVLVQWSGSGSHAEAGNGNFGVRINRAYNGVCLFFRSLSRHRS